jgi:hypothetical protein
MRLANRLSRSDPPSYDALNINPLSSFLTEEIMDDKSITAVATSLALMQIQVNALMLLLERHTAGAPIKEEFQQLVSEGVQTVGLETMEGIKNRICVAAKAHPQSTTAI